MHTGCHLSYGAHFFPFQRLWNWAASAYSGASTNWLRLSSLGVKWNNGTCHRWWGLCINEIRGVRACVCECGCVSKHQKEGQRLLGGENSSESQACVFQKWEGWAGHAKHLIKMASVHRRCRNDEWLFLSLFLSVFCQIPAMNGWYIYHKIF